MDYPGKDFLVDFDAWKTTHLHLRDYDRANVIFSIRYPQKKAFSYRLNRFVCIMMAVHGELPALIQDRIALRDGGNRGGGFVPDDLLLAMNEWYCSLSDSKMRTMPDPEWGAVLVIHDRNSKSASEA